MARKHKPEEPLVEAIAALSRLADAFARRRGQLARGAGLTEEQWRVLDEIAAEDFMPSMFARRKAKSAAAVSKVIRQLLDRKLVEASIASGDARQRRYALTARGRQALDAVRADRQRALDRVWSEIPARELAGFSRFALDLAERLEAHEQAEARRKSESIGRKKTRRSGSIDPN
jgi:DNA-binding MarR family transcriptional regulator